MKPLSSNLTLNENGMMIFMSLDIYLFILKGFLLSLRNIYNKNTIPFIHLKFK